MTQAVTVQVPQDLEELKAAKVKDLRAIVAVLKTEDADCLPQITVKSNKGQLVDALTEYMGFSEEEIEGAVEAEVQADITEAVESQDVLDFGDDVPTLETVTGDTEVDGVLAELGLEGLDMEPADMMSEEELAQTIAENTVPEAEEKKPRKKRATIPMDAPIPVRQYENLILGVYGNILEELEEPNENGFKFEEIKLERFNAKAHETFRKTKGHMHLLYTQAGSSYLIVMKKADGTLDPVLEVSNKGRGHLRCKQIANFLQVAYNEKNDQEVISSEQYMELAGQIELMPLNLPVVEAVVETSEENTESVGA
jgi:hypothetical protein